MIVDCNIAYNRSVRGGGLFSMNSIESAIISCSIKHNEAARGGVTYDYYLPNPNDPNGPLIQGIRALIRPIRISLLFRMTRLSGLHRAAAFIRLPVRTQSRIAKSAITGRTRLAAA